MWKFSCAKCLALTALGLHLSVALLAYLLGFPPPSCRLYWGPQDEHPQTILVEREFGFDPDIGKFRRGIQIYDPAIHTPKGATPVPYEDIQRLYNTTDSFLPTRADALLRLELREARRRRPGFDPVRPALQKALGGIGASQEEIDKLSDSLAKDEQRINQRDFRGPLGRLLADRGWSEEDAHAFLFGSAWKSSDFEMFGGNMLQWILQPPLLPESGALYRIGDGAARLLDLCEILGGVAFLLWGIAIAGWPTILPTPLSRRHGLLACLCLAIGALSELTSYILARAVFASQFITNSRGEVFYTGLPVSLWAAYAGVHRYTVPACVVAGLLALGVVCALGRVFRTGHTAHPEAGHLGDAKP